MLDVESLFDAYKNDVYRLALSYTKSVQEAEDVCQTVFLKAMEQQRITPGKERAWLLQVTANECRSLLRSAWWKRTAPLEECTAAAPEKSSGIYEAVMALDPNTGWSSTCIISNAAPRVRSQSCCISARAPSPPGSAGDGSC